MLSDLTGLKIPCRKPNAMSLRYGSPTRCYLILTQMPHETGSRRVRAISWGADGSGVAGVMRHPKESVRDRHN